MIAYPSYYQRWYAADAAAETADAATETADAEVETTDAATETADAAAETADAAAETTALDHGQSTKRIVVALETGEAAAKMDCYFEESMALAPSLEAR